MIPCILHFTPFRVFPALLGQKTSKRSGMTRLGSPGVSSQSVSGFRLENPETDWDDAPGLPRLVIPMVGVCVPGTTAITGQEQQGTTKKHRTLPPYPSNSTGPCPHTRPTAQDPAPAPLQQHRTLPPHSSSSTGPCPRIPPTAQDLAPHTLPAQDQTPRTPPTAQDPAHIPLQQHCFSMAAVPGSVLLCRFP